MTRFGRLFSRHRLLGLFVGAPLALVLGSLQVASSQGLPPAPGYGAAGPQQYPSGQPGAPMGPGGTYPAGQGQVPGSGYPAGQGQVPGSGYPAGQAPGAGQASWPSAPVTIAGRLFDPTERTIPVGTMITWTNGDTVAHTATSPGIWDSGQIRAGGTWSAIFAIEGTFNYRCTLHPEMQGTIIAGSGAAAPAAPPPSAPAPVPTIRIPAAPAPSGPTGPGMAPTGATGPVGSGAMTTGTTGPGTTGPPGPPR